MESLSEVYTVTVTIVARVCIITSDTLLIGITWWKLFSQVAFAQVVFKGMRTLTYIFLRDGEHPIHYAYLNPYNLFSG